MMEQLVYGIVRTLKMSESVDRSKEHHRRRRYRSRSPDDKSFEVEKLVNQSPCLKVE